MSSTVVKRVPGPSTGAMTINEAIARLSELRKSARFGGDTCLVICLDESEIEICHVQQLTLDQHPGEDGALVLVRGKIGG